jgi:hypothetical protein
VIDDYFLLLIASLACFRLTRLVTDDKIFAPIRAYLIRKSGRSKKVKEGITCPWCMSFYFAAGITAWLCWFLELEPRLMPLFGAAVWALSILFNGLFTFLVTYSKDE